jgi:hypothetical protein
LKFGAVFFIQFCIKSRREGFSPASAVNVQAHLSGCLPECWACHAAVHPQRH